MKSITPKLIVNDANAKTNAVAFSQVVRRAMGADPTPHQVSLRAALRRVHGPPAGRATRHRARARARDDHRAGEPPRAAGERATKSASGTVRRVRRVPPPSRRVTRRRAYPLH